MPVIINGSTGISGVDGSAATPAIQGTDVNTGIFYPAADTIAFGEGGAEVMRIDSSGFVGIGTTAPSAMLQVTGSASTEALKVPNIAEPATVSATAATGTINYDVCTQSVLYYTSNASANWTVTPKYQGGTAWSAGNASGIDVYTYTIIKTAAATFTVLASQTQFK